MKKHLALFAAVFAVALMASSAVAQDTNHARGHGEPPTTAKASKKKANRLAVEQRLNKSSADLANFATTSDSDGRPADQDQAHPGRRDGEDSRHEGQEVSTLRLPPPTIRRPRPKRDP